MKRLGLGTWRRARKLKNHVRILMEMLNKTFFFVVSCFLFNMLDSADSVSGQKRKYSDIWSRDEIISCHCSLLTYEHTHCPCLQCSGAAVSRSVEHYHWKRQKELEQTLAHSASEVIDLRDPTSVQEWTIVELQGVLETREEVSLEGKYIGDLHFDNMGVPQLIIGHHLLTGKVTNLDKPFAVMKKGTEREEPMEIGDRLNSKTGTDYNVVALIKRKIIFKNRPKPIIIKTEPIRK